MAGLRARRRRGVAVLLAGAMCLRAATATAGPTKHGLCGTATKGVGGPRLAVLSAFPAEIAPLVAAASVEKTVEVDGRQYYIGRLEGVRVVLGLTGIGLVNAADRTATVIRHFAPAGIVMSAVAGSPHNIADVVVATRWIEHPIEQIFPVNPAMHQIAVRGSTSLPAPLEDCTVPLTSASGALLCMPNQPVVVFADLGESSDPYGGKALACGPGGGDIFGCELPAHAAAAGIVTRPAAVTPEEAQDMETAEVARGADQHHVPFVAMRGVSDGAGDPKGDRGFPGQFFDYYRFAAGNAALVTRAFLDELNRIAHDPAARRVCRLLAQRRWQRAATLMGG